MEAILSSPSQSYAHTHLHSPSSDSSSGSDGSSPGLPDFSSPFAIANQLLKQQQQMLTPTKAAAAAVSAPDWLTDDLEEEWVEHDTREETQEEVDDVGEEEEDDDERTQEYGSSIGQQTPTQETMYFSPPSALRSMPRSLSRSRTSSAPAAPSASPSALLSNKNNKGHEISILHDLLEQDEDEYEQAEQAAVGTLVMRTSPLGSIVVNSHHGQQRGGDQLQAAVRALKGPSSGLGAAIDDEKERADGEPTAEGEDATPVKKTQDRARGLIGLFQPPTSINGNLTLTTSSTSAAVVAGKSVVVPTAAFFNFTPPPASNPQHSYTQPQTDNDNSVNIDIKSSGLIAAKDDDLSTPVQTTRLAAAAEILAPKHVDRYSHALSRSTTAAASSATAAALHALAASSASSATLIQTPALSSYSNTNSPHPDELHWQRQQVAPSPSMSFTMNMSVAPRAPPSSFFDSPPSIVYSAASSSSTAAPVFPLTPAPKSLFELDSPLLPSIASLSISTAMGGSGASGSRGGMFGHQYDTFTQEQLSLLVSELDAGGASRGDVDNIHDQEQQQQQDRNQGQEEYETDLIELSIDEYQNGDSDNTRGGQDDLNSDLNDIENEEEREEEAMRRSAGRSSKRIRLSPPLPPTPSPFSSPSSFQTSSTATGTTIRPTTRPTLVTPIAANRPRGHQQQRRSSGGSSSHQQRRRSSGGFSSRRARVTGHDRAEDRAADASSARSIEASASAKKTRDRISTADALLERIRARSNAASPSIAAAATPATSVARGKGRDGDSTNTQIHLQLTAPSPSPDRPPTAALLLATPQRAAIRQREHSKDVGRTDEEAQRKSIAHLAAAASASIRSALVSASTSGSPLRVFPFPTMSTFTMRGAGGGGEEIPASPRMQVGSLRSPMLGSSPEDLQSSASMTASGRARPHRVPVPFASLSRHSTSTNRPSPRAASTPASISAPVSHARPSNLMTIGPDDIVASALLTGTPNRMIFDSAAGRWIKSSRNAVASTSTASSGGARRSAAINDEEDVGNDTTEDDPFRDFGSDTSKNLSNITATLPSALSVPSGSLASSSAAVAAGLSGLGITSSGEGLTPVLVVSAPDASPPLLSVGLEIVEEEVTLEFELDVESRIDQLRLTEEDVPYDFEKEESPFDMYRAATGSEVDDALEDADTGEQDDQGQSESGDERDGKGGSILPAHIGSPLLARPSSISHHPNALTTPRPAPRAPVSVVRPRSALKPTTRTPFDAASFVSTTMTPDRRLQFELKEPRSVTFSDGKRHGPIRSSSVASTDNSRHHSDDDVLLDDDEGADGSLGDGEDGFVPMSVGSEEDLELEKEFATMERVRSTSVQIGSINSGKSRTTVSPRAKYDISQSHSHSRTFRRTTAADATFLTECSFGISHDRILKLITDVEPFEPDWEGLKSIDLSKKGVDSLVRLKEFLPNLDEVNLYMNDVSYLTGLPTLLRTLLVANNKLTSLVSFSHLLNLERIDISHNQVDSVASLACLRHLRELKADGNRISDLGGLAQIDGLVRLSLKGNLIESLDFSVTKWGRLELLNLSRNKIEVIVDLDRLQSLTVLNLDHNRLSELESTTSTMSKLRVLRISQNPLERLDLSFAPQLRTVFADATRLGLVTGTERLQKLENLSVRDQSGKGDALTICMSDVRDVKRLYLSGNPVPTSFPSEKFFNLVYLELAMCQLTELPPNLAELVPNVRVLNLNFNFIEDLAPLEGLTRLRRLSVLGARLSSCRAIVEILSTMPELESIDLRMNPCTLAFYPPLMVQSTLSIPPAHTEYQILHPDDDLPTATEARSQQWKAIDRKFRKSLPDVWRSKRNVYRSVVLRTSLMLTTFDGIDCAKERQLLLHD